MPFKYKLSRRLAMLFSSAAVATFATYACEQPVSLTPPAAEPDRLIVSPKTATVAPNQDVTFTSVALTAQGDTADAQVTWSATGGSVSGTSTSANGRRHYGQWKNSICGSYTVTATSNPGGKSDAASVAVTCPVAVGSVTVAPASATVPQGQTVQLAATVTDTSGTVVSGQTVTWASSNGAVATVSSSGLVTGVTAGSATITGSSGGRTGSSAVMVTPVSVTSVAVSPATASLQVGQTVQLTATPKDASGNAVSGKTVTWTSSNPSAATVNSSGVVTGAAAGSATITATSEGKSGSAAITVTVVSGTSAVFVGAGDIASCDAGPTAALLDNIAGAVFTAGDNAYPDGSTSDYATCYDPSWGRHKARTRPSPGNHEYNTSGATPYYSYFGTNAGPSGRGYYSYDVGDWHIISLNSNVSMSAGSSQEQWLRADLAASTKRCALAYWHYPRFSSGSHGSYPETQPLWQALYDYNADVVVVGHDHNYQRFAPQTPSGQADAARGIRQFVAGTGGASHYSFSSPIANTEAYNTSTYGVLKLTLNAGSYTWEFIPVAGQSYRDSGSGSCH